MPIAVSFKLVVTDGGGIVDGDFGVEVQQAADPGEALIKTGAGTYGSQCYKNKRSKQHC